MNEGEERKRLRQLLAAMDEATFKKWSWQAFTISAIAFCILTVIALWLLESSRISDAPLVSSLAGAVLAGAMIGALVTWNLLCKNSTVVRQYIDVDKVRARLAELEA